MVRADDTARDEDDADDDEPALAGGGPLRAGIDEDGLRCDLCWARRQSLLLLMMGWSGGRRRLRETEKHTLHLKGELLHLKGEIDA